MAHSTGPSSAGDVNGTADVSSNPVIQPSLTGPYPGAETENAVRNNWQLVYPAGHHLSFLPARQLSI